MGTYTFLVILIVIAALLMVGIVLIQESKGGGLASSFASYNQVAGVRTTTDVIEKTTWGLAAFMVVVSIICAYVAPVDESQNTVIEKIENPMTNPDNQNGFGASPVQEEAPAAAAEAPAAAAEAPAAEAPAAAAENQ